MTSTRSTTAVSPDAPAPDVVRVAVIDDQTLAIELDDGRSGSLNIGWLRDLPAYERLRNPSYFRMAAVEFGTVVWPEGEDLSPESIAVRLV